MNKFITLVLLFSAAPLLGMHSTVKRNKLEKSNEEKVTELKTTIKNIHNFLLRSRQERSQRNVTDVALAGYIDESFKALTEQSQQAKLNIKLSRQLARKYHQLLLDVLKLAQSLKTESDNLYNISMQFSELSEHYQDAVLENLTQVNSLYNSLIPILDYVDEKNKVSADFIRTMNDAREKIVVVREIVL